MNNALYKWSDLFGRTTDRKNGTPRFSLKGAKSYLYEYDGYSGGHPELDRIIELLKSNCVRCDVAGADSPMNVANFECEYHFDDGGFVIYSGNYFFGTPGQGAFVLTSPTKRRRMRLNAGIKLGNQTLIP